MIKAYLKGLAWKRSHENSALDLVRIFLGIALLIRGALFLADRSALMEFVQDRDLGWLLPIIMIHYVTLAHLYGGLIMSLGLLTRLSALVQIPILTGAVFFVHLDEGLLTGGQSLELSALVLFLLVVIFWFGPGKLSLDYIFFIREHTPILPPAPYDPVVHDAEVLERQRNIEAMRSRAALEHPVMSAADTDTAVMDVPLTVPKVALEIPPEIDAEAAARLKMGIKYATVFFFAFIMLVSMFLMEEVYINFTLEEFAVVGGVVILIFGMFYLFYRSAFTESTDT